MIGSAPEDRQKSNRPSIDPKDYIFSEETIQSLTELALLVRDIRARQAARQSKSNNLKTHAHNTIKNEPGTT
jgi:hypothetical protein